MTQMTPECSAATTRYVLEMTRMAMDPLVEALDVVSDDQLDEQPVPEQLPVGQMIEHALGAVAFTARAIRLGKCEESDVQDLMQDDDSKGTRPRIREIEAITRSEIEATLAELDAEAATRTIPYWFGWALTGLETANLGYQELCHHRGQVQSFLRLMGYEPPDIHAPAKAAGQAVE